jgi:hypothetical protein
MELWSPVVILSDGPGFEFAVAARAVLELYRYRVHLVYCPTRETMARALAGDLPPSEHVIYFGFPPETPQEVAAQVKMKDRLVIMVWHPGEFDEMAKAWLKAGCRVVMRPTEDVHQNACLTFVLAFYYHLLSHEFPGGGERLTEREAFEKARRFDLEREGTGAFGMMEATPQPR